MSWFVYALLCAVFLSAASLIEKRVLRNTHAIDYSATLAVANLFISLPFIFFIDFSKVSFQALLLIFITAFFASMAFYLVAKAVRHLEISTVSPLLALSPGTTSILAFFVLGEALSAQNITGIVFMIIGSYVLGMDPKNGLLEPLKVFIRSKYIHFIFLSLLLYSVGAVLDRAIVSVFEVPVVVYIFFVHLFTSVLYLPISSFFNGSVGGVIRTLRTSGSDVFFASIFTVGYRFFQMEAIQLVSVGLVSAIKRSSTFITTMVGGELFHEKNLARKMFASIIIIGGVLFIVL